ncbi:MAG: NADH-quinone oxidoreductase subunit NuoE [Candidatus Bipolaricaulota bacterium]|nr:NADH-quinone oxidoreductase subunit NuoE [Candidatus Bipolaricaulota bacterium]
MDERSQGVADLDARWARFPRDPESIIPLLQEVQETSGYLSEADCARVAEYAKAPISTVFGVATFYSQFRLRRPGLHTVRVCEGTACHVLGANDVMETFKELLGVDVGETTADGVFTLESVRCLGCCSLAPAVMVDGKTHARVGRKQIEKILSDCRKDGA